MMNNSYVIDMFPLPFAHTKVKRWEEKKEKILSLKKYGSIPQDTEENLITDYYDNPRHSYDYSNDVYEILKNDIESFCLTVKYGKCKIEDSWIQTTKDSMCHRIHNHGPLGYSAVCYLKFNPEVHQPTHFVGPFHNISTGNINQFVPKGVGEGSLIFFPSMINHFTVPSFSEEERTILSFNLKRI